MYKRKAPGNSSLSLSLSKSLKTNRTTKPTRIAEAVVEANNENESGIANDISDDVEDFPASQPAIPPPGTQGSRYLSQRSNINRSQLSFSAQQNSTARRVPNSYYEKILLRCGVVFENQPFIILGCDHLNFVRKLRTMLSSEPDHPQNIERFVSGLKEYVSEEQQLFKVLTVCVPSLEPGKIPQSQDCLMRNFIMIDYLEPKIVELLLDSLASLAAESNPTDQHVSMFMLILTQLGFVNKRNNSDQIYSQIVALFGLTEDIFRNAIIKFLPEILDTRKHDLVVEKIISLMGSDPHKYLNEVTVDSFEALQLSPRLRTQLKTRILTYIQDESAPMRLYPVFTKFLLNCDPSENHIELINRYRKTEWSAGDATMAKETQKEVFQIIHRALKRSKELNECWVKSILNSDECYPMDLLSLILLSDIDEDRRLYLEGVLKRKIKTRALKRHVFCRGITEFPLVISQHLKVFFEFIDNLFRTKDELFEFGEIGYKLAFGIPNCDHKLLLFKLVGFICEKNSDFVVRRALMLLQEINEDYPDLVQTNSLQILRVLDKVNDVGLFEYRLIMDLLGSIAYPPPPALPIDGVASHIDILIRKQVTGSGDNIRRQGIVGSVRIIDHLVWHLDESSATDGFDSEKSVLGIEDLPPGNGKTAAEAIKLMLQSSENCPKNRALIFDELSAALCPRLRNTKKAKVLNRAFLGWLCELVTAEFHNTFITQDYEESSDAKLDKMFRLNRDEDYIDMCSEARGTCVNIGGLIYHPSYKNYPVILTLSPIFNIVRILYYHGSNGSLEDINALIGCPVVIPQFINSPEDYDMDGDTEKAALAMDTLFFTANWFREIICAFASQREATVRPKVLQRLSDLIRLEENIRNILKRMPHSYTPPKVHFMADSNHEAEKKTKAIVAAKPGKAKKNATDSIPNNSTLMATGDQSLLQSSRVEENKRSNSMTGFYGPKEVYRQLDPDILLLLMETLCTAHPLPRDRMGQCLGLSEYKFIVEDLILKLESVTGLKKCVGFQQDQFVYSGDLLVYDLGQFLGRFMQFFDQLTSAIQRNKEMGEGGGTEDPCLYTDEMNLLKKCFGLTLRLLGSMFSWQGFNQEKHQKLLKDSLIVVLREKESVDKSSNLETLCKRVIDAMLSRSSSVLDLTGAVALNQLIVALSGFTNDYSESVALCEKFLKCQWNSHTGAVERGCEANVLLNELLKGSLRSLRFQSLMKLLKKTSQEVDELNGKEKHLRNLPNFNKTNFPILFRALANAIYELIMDRLEKDQTSRMKLELWETVYEAQNYLLEMVKTVKISRNFTIYLKYSQLILKLFLQHGMPVVESSLKANPDRVKSLLKSVQGTTRFLHKLCCQSKSLKNTSIIALIPGLRQLLESFNYAVKAALAVNKFSAAFLLGNLKNNDLQGEQILSQVMSTAGEEEEEDVAEDFPSDDESVTGASYLLGITAMDNTDATVDITAVAGTSGKRGRKSRK